MTGASNGVADDGIYLPDGDDDAGKAIDAMLEMGSTTFGTSSHKSNPSIYLGVASGDRMLVKVAADGAEYVRGQIQFPLT